MNLLILTVTMGGVVDHVSTAQSCGWLQTSVCAGLFHLERLLEVRNPSIHMGLDFEAPETAVTGAVGISIRIGTLLAVAFGVGTPALRWFLRFRKRQKTVERPAKAAA